jgi:hypothetical protein
MPPLNPRSRTQTFKYKIPPPYPGEVYSLGNPYDRPGGYYNFIIKFKYPRIPTATLNLITMRTLNLKLHHIMHNGVKT